MSGWGSPACVRGSGSSGFFISRGCREFYHLPDCRVRGVFVDWLQVVFPAHFPVCGDESDRARRSVLILVRAGR